MNRVTDFPLIVRAISESCEKLSRVDNCLEMKFFAVIIWSTFSPYSPERHVLSLTRTGFCFIVVTQRNYSVNILVSIVIHSELKS